MPLPECLQDLLKSSVVFQRSILERGKGIPVPEMAQRDRHIVVVDREFLRPVMTAVLGGERVEPPDCPAAFHRLQVLHETRVPGSKPLVDVQRQDMLRHRIEGEDIGAVEGVQRGGLQQDIPDVFVAGGIVLKQPVQRLLLVSIVFQFMPLGEIPSDLLRAGRRNVRSLPTLPSGRALLRLLREDEAAELLVDKLGLKPVSGDNKGVLLLKREDGSTEIDFFVNVTDKKKRFVIGREDFSGAEILNAENGEISPAEFTVDENGVSVEINIPANGSVIVSFTNDRVKSSRKAEEEIVKDITENWIVGEIGKIVGRADFFAAGKDNFSGEVAFVKKVEIEKPAGKLLLSLENVDTYASVKVNGKFAGARLWSPYVFDITDCVLSGANEIELTIGSTEENVMTGSNKNYGVFGRIVLTEIKQNG